MPLNLIISTPKAEKTLCYIDISRQRQSLIGVSRVEIHAFPFVFLVPSSFIT